MKALTTIVFLLFVYVQTAFAKEFYEDSMHNKCKKIKDTLTQTNIYVEADVVPWNEGGAEYFNKKLQEIVLDSVPDNYDGHFAIAFITDTSGGIYGERIIKAPIAKTGRDILKLIKSLRWKAALCNGKKVPMLYMRNVNIDVTEN